MSTALWFDLLLACFSGVLAFFLSLGTRKASTKIALIVSIMVSVALLIADRIVWADTGKGLLDHATCLAMPRARSCGGAKVEPAVKLPTPKPAPVAAAGTVPVRVAPAARNAPADPQRSDTDDRQAEALKLLTWGRAINFATVPVATARAQVARQPRDADLWQALGASLTVAGNLKEATAAFERATQLPPKYIGRAYLYRDLAESLESVGDLEGALAAARVSLRTWPLSRDGLFCTGAEVQLTTRLLVKLGRLKEAADFFHSIFERHTDHSMTCDRIDSALAAAAR
jgi:hypothetical protein